VVGSAAGRLTARRSWFQSTRYRAARAAIVPWTTTRPSAAPGKARRWSRRAHRRH